MREEDDEVKGGIGGEGRKAWEEKGEDVVECARTEGLVRPSRKCTLTARDAFYRRRRGITGSTITSRPQLRCLKLYTD